MAIVIEEPKQEGWSHTLSVKGLVAGDYLVISIDGFKMNGESRWFNDSQYGKSYLSYVDVFEYSYFDVDNRAVVDKKLDSPVRCSYFLSEALLRKIDESKVPHGQMMKIGMKKLDGGKSTYVVEQFVPGVPGGESSSPSTTVEPSDNDVGTVEEVSFDSAEKEGKLKQAVESLKKANMDDNTIVTMLKGEFTEEKVRELL